MKERKIMVRYIRKRDGKTVDFDEGKIRNAILLAMKQVGIEGHIEDARFMAYRITSVIQEDTIDVEEVQNMVEDELMEAFPTVAKAYIKYRQERTRIRRMNTDITKHVKEILSCSNIQNSNANVDEYSFGGRKNEASNLIQKDLALNDYVAPDVAKAHIDNELYIHDLSEYTSGSHNCLHVDLRNLLLNGFKARNGDVRKANSFSTACQQVAVIFQIQSQVQFGGVASASLDYHLAPFVRISFLKHFKKGLKYVDRRRTNTWIAFNIKYNSVILTASIDAECNIFKTYSKTAYIYAIESLEEEGLQSAQALYHNLNTLESRAGAQLPFTSINFGDDTTFEGRKVTEWCLKASIEGIGRFGQTPIFPISIFKYKVDVNDRPGTPNYDLKCLAIESLCKRIYPNIVNCDWSMNKADALPSKYVVDAELKGDEKVSGRIGNKLYKNIPVSELYNLIDAMEDKYKEYTHFINGVRAIDIRFTDTVVCINDKNSQYTDYAIKLNDHMARINYIAKDGYLYSITTDSFSLDINGVNKQYDVPKYDYDTEMATMGCRTLIGYDINGMGYKKTGRGNITPVTINLVKIGIENGICLKKRSRAKVKGFFEDLDRMLKLGEKALLERFKFICSQDYRSGLFMYINGTIADADKSLENGVFESLKHGTNALGLTL
jgi:ribonucleoside-triphosphate reductase